MHLSHEFLKAFNYLNLEILIYCTTRTSSHVKFQDAVSTVLNRLAKTTYKNG